MATTRSPSRTSTRSASSKTGPGTTRTISFVVPAGTCSGWRTDADPSVRPTTTSPSISSSALTRARTTAWSPGSAWPLTPTSISIVVSASGRMGGEGEHGRRHGQQRRPDRTGGETAPTAAHHGQRVQHTATVPVDERRRTHAAYRSGLPVQPHRPGRCAGAGARARPRAAPAGPRGPCARPVRRPAARGVRHAARQQPADGGQRFGRPAGAGRVGGAAHDPRPQRRGVRRHPRPRADGAGAADDGGDLQAGADDRHVPRGRALVGLPGVLLVPEVGRWAHRSQGRGVQERPRAGAVAPRRRVRHPVQRRRDRRDRRRRADAGESPDDLLLRAPRGAQGPGGAARGVHHAARRRPAVDRQ